MIDKDCKNMTKTKTSEGYRLFNDQKVNEAIQTLSEKLNEYKSHITGVKPPSKELEDSYQEKLEEFFENRGGKLFFPYLGSGLGHGPFVELADGSVKYDFISGIGVHYFGHSHTGIMKAMVKSSLGNTAMQGHLQQNMDSAHYVKSLLKHANKNGADLAHCFLTTTGAMANENALKIAFQKTSPSTRVLAFEKCFSGRTIALANITDKPAYRDGLPEALNVDYIPFYDENNHRESIEKAKSKLEEHIQRHPGKHAAFIMELIQGEAGSFVGNKEYFETLIKVCKAHKIALIFDEVQTFARTSELFAFQHFELDQYVEIVTVGKTSQVCSTLFTKEYKPKPGLISQTFTTSTANLAAAQCILDSLMEGGYLGKDGKNMRLHAHFKAQLEKLSQKYPEKLQGPFGLGGMVALTLFKGDPKKTGEFTHKLFKNGVMGFMAGASPTRLRFLIPVGAIETEDIDAVVEIFEKTLTQTQVD